MKPWLIHTAYWLSGFAACYLAAGLLLTWAEWPLFAHDTPAARWAMAVRLVAFWPFILFGLGR